jgi:hypothetical protein
MPPIRATGTALSSRNPRLLKSAGAGSLRPVSQSGTRVTGLSQLAPHVNDETAGMNRLQAVTNAGV